MHHSGFATRATVRAHPHEAGDSYSHQLHVELHSGWSVLRAPTIAFCGTSSLAMVCDVAHLLGLTLSSLGCLYFLNVPPDSENEQVLHVRPPQLRIHRLDGGRGNRTTLSSGRRCEQFQCAGCSASHTYSVDPAFLKSLCHIVPLLNSAQQRSQQRRLQERLYDFMA